MKKFILFFTLFLFLLLINFPFLKATALEEKYLKITDDSTMFYINSSLLETDELFSIPQGYYVLVQKEHETYYEVSYGENTNSTISLLGFVKKSTTLKENTEEDIFPCFLNFKITPKIDTKLYSKDDTNSTIKYAITTGQTLNYIGSKNALDKVFYFVQMGNSFGYVESTAFDTLTLPPHKIPIEEPQEELDTSPDTTLYAKDTNDIAKAIKTGLIVLITIPAVIIVFIIFTPTKKKKY